MQTLKLKKVSILGWIIQTHNLLLMRNQNRVFVLPLIIADEPQSLAPLF